MFKKIIVALAMLVAATAFAAVDANTASQADLQTVKGIGPTLSSAIVNERKKGAFKDWNDMVARVKGIGDKSAAGLSEGGLTVNGAAYPGAPAKADAPVTAKVASAASRAASAAKSAAEEAASATKGAVKEAASATKGAVKEAASATTATAARAASATKGVVKEAASATAATAAKAASAVKAGASAVAAQAKEDKGAFDENVKEAKARRAEKNTSAAASAASAARK